MRRASKAFTKSIALASLYTPDLVLGLIQTASLLETAAVELSRGGKANGSTQAVSPHQLSSHSAPNSILSGTNK